MRPTTVIAWTVVVVCLLGGAAGLALSRRDLTSPAVASPSVPGTSTVSTSPSAAASPTGTSAAPVAPATPNTSAPTTAPTTAPATSSPMPPRKQDATVIITYADVVPDTGTIEVGAYASLVEEGGTCRLVATNGSATVETSRRAALDASTTSCGGLTLARARTGSGTWTLTVTYESSTSSGTSEPATVTVP